MLATKPQVVKTEVTDLKQTSPGNYLLFFQSMDIASQVRPGQFVMVKCGPGPERILRRPLSVHYARSPLVALYFAAVGAGTKWLASLKSGDDLDVLGPLGNSFEVKPETKHLLLLGGGMGISPLVFLAAESVDAGLEVTLVHGAATASQLHGLFGLEGRPQGSQLRQNAASSLSEKIRIETTTEDGSAGRKGRITDYLGDFVSQADQICACGPAGMYASMLQQAHLFQGKSVHVSLETRMGCGIGACFGCTVNTKKGPKRVCREGPVFDLDDLILSELEV